MKKAARNQRLSKWSINNQTHTDTHAYQTTKEEKTENACHVTCEPDRLMNWFEIIDTIW